MILNQGGGGIVPKKTIDETTITPGTEDQVIEAQTYLRGKVTVEGEPNLVPENIPIDISMFGVNGTKTLDIQNGVKSTYKSGESISPGNFITHDYNAIPDMKYNSQQYRQIVFPGTNNIGILSDVTFSDVNKSAVNFTFYGVDTKGALIRLFNASIPAIASNALGASDYSGAAYVVQILPLDSKRFVLVYAQATGKTQIPTYSTYYEYKLGISIYKINDAKNGIETELEPTRLPNVSTWTSDSGLYASNIPRVTGILPYTELETDKRLIVFIEHVPDYNNIGTYKFGHCIVDYNTSTTTITSITPLLYSICTSQGIDTTQTGKHYRDEKGNYHIVSLSRNMADNLTTKYTWTYFKVVPLNGVSQIVLSPVTILLEASSPISNYQFIDIWGEDSDEGTTLRVAFNSSVLALSKYGNRNLGMMEIFTEVNSYVPVIQHRKDLVALSYPIINLTDRSKWNYITKGYSNEESIVPCAVYFLSKNCLLLTLYVNSYGGVGLNQLAFAVSVGNTFQALTNNFRARLLPGVIPGTSTGQNTFMTDTFVGRNTTQTSQLLILPAQAYVGGAGIFNARKESFLPAVLNCKLEGNYTQIDGVSITTADANKDIEILELGG